MSDIAVAVENLSKQYAIGHLQGGDGLRHSLERFMRNPVRWLRARRQAQQAANETFWALRDVSFEVKQGDTVALIGRNGAGKSTLLKILSRITEPTHGRVRLNGRVASLLEVGTGFHQELTGRENIFLNGAILGMSKAEIARKFDAIVAFSEIEKFLDTPVKRYSSGMYVRLAFAVAAHLEPEILIVDEVLAVGDAAFQKKCLGKMEEAAHGGRTVLFVSHNMPAVQALCRSAVLLQAGVVKATGDAPSIIQRYLTQNTDLTTRRFPVVVGRDLRIESFDFSPVAVESGSPVAFKLLLRAERATRLNEIAVTLSSDQGTRIAILDLRPFGLPATLSPGQLWPVTGRIKSVPLIEGDYSAGLYLNATDLVENVSDLATLSIRPRARTGACAPFAASYRGVVDLEFTAAAGALDRHTDDPRFVDRITLTSA